jgi:hypothetical protein
MTSTHTPLRSSTSLVQTARSASTLSTLAYVAVATGAVAVSVFAMGLGLITLG